MKIFFFSEHLIKKGHCNHIKYLMLMIQNTNSILYSFVKRFSAKSVLLNCLLDRWRWWYLLFIDQIMVIITGIRNIASILAPCSRSPRGGQLAMMKWPLFSSLFPPPLSQENYFRQLSQEILTNHLRPTEKAILNYLRKQY